MPDRLTPPLDKRSLLDTLFPVNPLEVAGGLYGLGTQAVGNAASYAASHGPLDALAGGPASNPDTQANANQFGQDVTAMLDSPAHGHVTPSAAAIPIAAAGAKLLPEAETVASTLAKSAEPVAAAAPPIVAYHGSPHSFDRFDISKIGTGEGAQAYGHGLYFAENENVARGYKSAGQPFYLGDDRRQAAQQVLEQAAGDRNAALALADQNMRGTTKYGEGKMWQDVVNNFDDLTSRPPGSMYQVGINADPAGFLDWDKPLSQQHPAVQDALSKMGIEGGHQVIGPDGRMPEFYPTLENAVEAAKSVPGARGITKTDPVGSDLYASVARQTVNGDWGPPGDFAQQQAAQTLQKAGVPGIRYLDQGSRTPTTLFNGSPIPDDNPAAQLAAEKLDLHGSPDVAMSSLADDAANGHPYIRDVSSAAHDLLESGQISRSQSGGTSNYVLFDDSLASILKKYGLAGLGTAGGAAALTAGGQSPVSSPAEAAPTGASVASPFY